DKDAGHVQPCHGHDAAGHVLVAAADGEQAIVVHSPCHDFQAIGNDLARDQAVAHALVAHHDAVRGGRRTKDLRHSTPGPNTLTAALRQAVQMCVAGCYLAEKRGDADHWPIEIFIVKTHGAEHGTI